MAVFGKPGPGITRDHLKHLQKLATQTGRTIFVHGSRQTGISVHSGRPFASNADLDIGVIGKISDLLAVARAEWSVIPNVEHAPMRVVASIEEAVAQGFFVIQP